MIGAFIRRNVRGTLMTVGGAATGIVVGELLERNSPALMEPGNSGGILSSIPAPVAAVPTKSAQKPADASKDWKPFRIASKDFITHDTARLRLVPENPEEKFMFNAASCITIRAFPEQLKGEKEGSKAVVRPYTPVNRPGDVDGIDLIVKGYNDGALSHFLVKAELGAPVGVKGPFMKFPYETGKYNKIIMLAGGTGVTPMLQLIQHIVYNDDFTEVILVDFNKTEDDIIVRDLLTALETNYPHFSHVHVLSRGDEAWPGHKGHISRELLENILQPILATLDKEKSLVCVCGPPGFVEVTCGPKDRQKQGPVTGILAELGFDSSNVFKF